MKLNKSFKILEKQIGDPSRPYVIAEAGSNFNQSLDTAKKLIDVAANSGADAVKFQLFRADVLYPSGGEMYDLFKSIELNAEWLPGLSDHAKNQSLHFMASAFDVNSIEALQEADVPAYKIASSEAINYPLLIEIAKIGKPLFISTGMCTLVDIEQIIDVCQNLGNHEIALLQCGAQYPLPEDLANIRVIPELKKRYSCPVGFSDHTLGLNTAITAVGAGANIFEKHFTLDKAADGPDHFYALEPNELKDYIQAIHQASQSLGDGEKNLLEKERRLGRRDGIYAAKQLKAGSKLLEEDIEIKRPAIGISGRYKDAIIGVRLDHDVSVGDPIEWDSLAGQNSNES